MSSHGQWAAAHILSGEAGGWCGWFVAGRCTAGRVTRLGDGVLALLFPVTSDPWGVVCGACWPGHPGAGFRSWGSLVVSLCGLLVAGVLMMPTLWSLQVMCRAALVILMVRVLWVMQWGIATLVVPMVRVVQVKQRHCAAGDVPGEGAVGDVAGDDAAGDAGGEGGAGNAPVDGEVGDADGEGAVGGVTGDPAAGGAGGDGAAGAAGDVAVGCAFGDADGEGGVDDTG